MMNRLKYKQNFIQTNEIFMKLTQCFSFVYFSSIFVNSYFTVFKISYFLQMILNLFLFLLLFKFEVFQLRFQQFVFYTVFALRQFFNVSRQLASQYLILRILNTKHLQLDLSIIEAAQAIAKIIGVLLSILTLIVFDVSHKKLQNLENLYLF